MENKSVQLIPREIREANWPRARFLSDEEQTKYEEATKKIDLEVVGLDGSNLPKVVLLNELGIRTATIPELYNVWETNPEFLSGHYEDVASVVLRSKGDSHKPNNDLAIKLAEAIKVKNFNHSYVLNGLKLEIDKTSQYGYALIPGENFEFFKAPEFDHLNNQRKFSKVDERGIPIFEDKGNRILYTREDGLSGLFVDGDSDLGSDGGDLSGSYSSGRVVVVDAEGVAPDLDKYVAD